LSSCDKAFGDDDFTLKPTAKSGGVFTYSTDKTDVFTVDAKTGVVKIVGVGTATLTARVASTTNYEAGAVSASVTVKKGTPTLAWSLDPKTFGDAPFQLGAPVTKSDGTFSYSVSTADAVLATVTADGKVTIKQAGSVTITAKQASTTLWNEASMTAVLTIDKAVPTLSGFTIPTKTFGDAPFLLTAPTSNVPQSVAPFTYEVVSPTGATCSNSMSSVASPGVVASVTCGTGQVTVSGVGSVQIRARQQASTNYTTASITTTLTVAKASQQSPITDGLVAKWSFDSLSTLGTNSVGKWKPCTDWWAALDGVRQSGRSAVLERNECVSPVGNRNRDGPSGGQRHVLGFGVVQCVGTRRQGNSSAGATIGRRGGSLLFA